MSEMIAHLLIAHLSKKSREEFRFNIVCKMHIRGLLHYSFKYMICKF